MSYEVEYPVDMPVEPIKDIVRIFRDGKAAEETALLIYAAWVIAGFALRHGVPVGPDVIGETVIACEADVVTALEPFTVISSEPAKAIPWAILVQVALFLLNKFAK